MTYFLLAPASLLIAGTAAGGVFLGINLLGLAASRGPSPKKLKAAGVSAEELQQALTLGHNKLKTMRALAQRFPYQRVQRRALDVCEIVAKILRNIEHDPRDLRPSRQFLNYYLDSAVEIFRQYLALSRQGIRSKEVEDTMIKAEDTIVQMKAAFDTHLAKLLENDLLHLDTEMDVLRKTFELEGLGKPGSAGKQNVTDIPAQALRGTESPEEIRPLSKSEIAASIDAELEELRRRVRENEV